MIAWEDLSDEDGGIQFRHVEPNVVLTDLHHFDEDRFDPERYPTQWRLNLTRYEPIGDPNGELVTLDLDHDDCPEPEAKAWATAQIAKFLTR